MPGHRLIKDLLLVVGGLLFLALAYVGFDHWRKSPLTKAIHDPDQVIRMDAVRKAGKAGYERLRRESSGGLDWRSWATDLSDRHR